MRSTMTVFACVVFLAVPVAIVRADDVAAPAASATPTAPAAAVPQGTSAPAAQAAPGTAVPAASAAAPGVAAAAAEGTSSATGSEPIKLGIEVPPASEFKLPPGFRPVKKGIETVYCKSYTPVGSRLPQQACYSREQVAAMVRQGEQDRQMMHQKTTNGGTSGN